MKPGARSCGCFDGHYIDGDESAVAIRCQRHAGVPAEIAGAPVRMLEEVQIARMIGSPSATPARRRSRPVARRRVRVKESRP